MSEKQSGYIEKDPRWDWLHNPSAAVGVMLLWTVSVVCIALGVWPLAFAFLNYILCRHYFIGLRWKSLARGCGAPGFIAHWLGGAVLLLTLTAQPNTSVFFRDAAIWMLRVDFACIILSAGFYKYFSGYRSGEGMEYGMVNPMWGYWYRFWSAVAPKHPVFRLHNEAAWFTEVLAGILMLVPVTVGWGGLLLAGVFIFILTQIRLGFLCHMVIVVTLLYARPGDVFSGLVPSWGQLELLPGPSLILTTASQKIIGGFFVLHAFLIIACFAGLWHNQLSKGRLPGILQSALDRYANWFGIIIWRVFSSDLTRFEVSVFAGMNRDEVLQVSGFGKGMEFSGARYLQVYESITAACLFTTLNYYPGQRNIFYSKLIRYARSIQNKPKWVRFDIHLIEKSEGTFTRRFVASYSVDANAGTVQDHELQADWIKPHGPTLLHASARPGSYAAGL